MKARLAMVGAVGTFLLGGCVMIPAPINGWVFSEIKWPGYYDGAAEKGPGSKKGTATAQGILGLIAQGDSSVSAACANGGITTIHTVDHETKIILGVWGTFTTIVTGE